MPNWCANRITASGEAADIAALKALVGSEETAFDFNAIVPMPEILKHKGWGWRQFEIEGETVGLQSWYVPDPSEPLTGARPFTAEEQAQLDEIGAKDWYEWCNRNWGCKWNAAGADMTEDEDDYAAWVLDTPWGPPLAVVEALRQRFPDLRFVGFYDEPGMMVAGYY
jgi:hypothetical protein